MAGSPMAALLPALLARMGGSGGNSPAAIAGGAGGGPGGPPGGPGTGPSGTPADAMASASFGRELSSLRQADPAALSKSIMSVKQQVMDLINQTGMSVPGVARALTKIVSHLDTAFEEASQAMTNLQIASPINSSAAIGAPGAGMTPPAVGTPGVGQF